MIRTFGVAVSMVILQCILTAGAGAQNTCLASSLFFWGDTIPAGWVCGPGEGPFSMVCVGPSGNCAPSRWCPTCGQFVPVGGSPINLTNGNTYIRQQDLRVPGLGGGLALERTWNSIWPGTIGSYQSGMFGLGWRSTYEERVFLSGSYMYYLQGDGGYWVFSNMGSYWKLSSPNNVIATLTQGSTYWTLAFQNGEQKQFSVLSGSLTAIIDRNGNTTQLTYDGTNRLATVTDPASRTLTFTYGNSSTPSLVTSVSSSVSLSLSYTYDSTHRLTQVTKPDSSTISFEFDTGSRISAVKDSAGIVLESHTYDSNGRGLTSSRANGVQAITVSYP